MKAVIYTLRRSIIKRTYISDYCIWIDIEPRGSACFHRNLLQLSSDMNATYFPVSDFTLTVEFSVNP